MPYKFYGGVHPAAFKTLTSDRPIKRVFIPKKVILPLVQHVGSASEALVAPGDSVKVGQLIARGSGFISSALHSSLSGKVTKIAPSPTPTQPRVNSITIESQNPDDDQDFKIIPAVDIEKFSVEEIIKRIKDAGIVGLGGAAFPTHVKFTPLKNKPVDTIIVNGAECEPYITCDHRIMLEKSKEILKGLDVAAKTLGVKEAYIAIEDNKLSGIYAMERAISKFSPTLSEINPKIVTLKTKYPQGAEEQLVKSVLNRVVPAGGLPMDAGCVVQNIGTIFAIYEAVYFGKPLIERAVTITGDCVREPVNIWVRIGTLLSDLIGSIGPFTKDPHKVIAGGPMMGIAQYTMDFPITKGVGGIVFLSKDEIDRSAEEVCIRCGKCLEICPMGLVPTSIMQWVKKGNFSEAKEIGISNCFECGACAYACPAKIPLLDYMKFGKAKILK